MKSILSFCCIAVICTCFAYAQDVLNLNRPWKFHTGDNPAWADPHYNDNDTSWKSLRVGRPWEYQGYPGLDGYAWYRLHVTIPSSLKTSSYLKVGLRIELGEIDDGDQTFLNGKLIGTNAGQSTDITQGKYDVERVYSLKLTDPSIHWDADNVIAIRVFDHGGNGGMWAGKYTLEVADLSDYVDLDFLGSTFSFTGEKTVKKTITLKCTYPGYQIDGILQVQVTDPLTGKTIWDKSVPAAFSAAKPFQFEYSASLPDRQSYLANYTFTESHSRKTVTGTEGIPYILTPKPSPKPRINGAKVVGERPGNPFLFKIPATGTAPIRFQAQPLPEGLRLDPSSGIISGTAEKAGVYLIHIKATNRLGSDSEDLNILVGNQIALTPAMGWNSWNCWGLSVSDDKVRASANAMVKKGLINHGWTYINIDDGWEQGRDSAGRILPNAKFPDMKALTAYIHKAGLKMGIYSSPGPKTCGGYTGSYQHEQQDADTYAAWGIDYLKYDWCSYGDLFPHPDLAEMQKPYQLMRKSLDQVHRDILFSLCQYGMGKVWTWGGEVGGNSWRTTGDINDSWSSLSTIGFHQDVCAPFTKPGNWNDPDMLVVGRVGWGPSLHNSRLTPDEQYTHISLWCILSAPLLIGCDMSQLDDFTLNLLSNDEVLAVDQDPMGNSAQRLSVSGDIQIWTKRLSDGSQAVGIFNLGEKPETGTLKVADLQMGGLVDIRDLWRQKDLGVFNQVYDTTIPSHGVVLVKVRAAK